MHHSKCASLPLLRATLRALLPAMAVALLLCLAACSDEQQLKNAAQQSQTQSPGNRPLFGLFLASSGLGDRGFMDSTYQGFLRAQQKHDARIIMQTQPRQATPQEETALLQAMARQGADLAFCSSASMRQALHLAAPKHPQTTFALLDTKAQSYPPNVCSATFASEQAAFLAGALAARMSRSKAIGIIGGKNIPPVQDFVLGFQAGALHAMPTAAVHIEYIHDHDPETIVWNNPETAASLAATLHKDHGVDVLFAVAGGSGIGVMNYVANNHLYGIGVDSDQDYMAEGRILTSVIKRMDVAVTHIADSFQHGRLENRNYRFSLADGGVGLSKMRYTRDLIPEAVHEMLDSLRKDIISGKITVPAATPTSSQ